MVFLPVQRFIHWAAIFIAFSNCLVHATYLIDDRDSKITYAPRDIWFKGLNISKVFYDGTITEAYCHTSQNCTMTIPFNGSGITLYAEVTYALTFNVSIDGGTPTTHELDGVWGCCYDNIHPASNISIYDVSSLSPSDHTLLFTLLNSTEGYIPPGPPNNSYIAFDYAVVSELDPNSTSSVTLPHSASHSMKLGPVVGGAIGAVLALTFILFIFI